MRKLFCCEMPDFGGVLGCLLSWREIGPTCMRVVTSERRLKGEERGCELATLHEVSTAWNNHLSVNYLPTHILWHCWILEKRFVQDAVYGLGSWWLLLEWYLCAFVTACRNCLEFESHWTVLVLWEMSEHVWGAAWLSCWIHPTRKCLVTVFKNIGSGIVQF